MWTLEGIKILLMDSSFFSSYFCLMPLICAIFVTLIINAISADMSDRDSGMPFLPATLNE